VIVDEINQDGNKVDVSATRSVWTTAAEGQDCDNPPHCYVFQGGTSFATPQVAAVAALMKAANPLISARNIEFLVRNTAIKKGSIKIGGVDQDPALNPAARYDPTTGHNRHMGFGMLNALEALQDAHSWSAIGEVRLNLSGTGRDVNPDEEIRISWESAFLNSSETLDIDLVDLTGSLHPIWSNIPANASNLIWNIPADFPTSSTYRVRVKYNFDDRVFGFSDQFVTVHDHWIETTSSHNICNQGTYTLTWETSYPETREILLEVEAGDYLATVPVNNTGAFDLDALWLNQVLLSQSSDPDSYRSQITFRIRLFDATESNVSSQSQWIQYGIDFVQPCDQGWPVE
jgi:hypothetical protein